MEWLKTIIFLLAHNFKGQGFEKVSAQFSKMTPLLPSGSWGWLPAGAPFLSSTSLLIPGGSSPSPFYLVAGCQEGKTELQGGLCLKAQSTSHGSQQVRGASPDSKGRGADHLQRRAAVRAGMSGGGGSCRGSRDMHPEESSFQKSEPLVAEMDTQQINFVLGERLSSGPSFLLFFLTKRDSLH